MVKNVMDSWAARDSVEKTSDSSEHDTSDCDAVGVLIFPCLLAADFCSNCFFLTLVASPVPVFHSIAFLDSWDCVLGNNRVIV